MINLEQVSDFNSRDELKKFYSDLLGINETNLKVEKIYLRKKNDKNDTEFKEKVYKISFHFVLSKYTGDSVSISRVYDKHFVSFLKNVYLFDTKEEAEEYFLNLVNELK